MEAQIQRKKHKKQKKPRRRREPLGFGHDLKRVEAHRELEYLRQTGQGKSRKNIEERFRKLQEIKSRQAKEYSHGDRVYVVSSLDDRLKKGMSGTVFAVDVRGGVVFVHWDFGITTGVILGKDEIKKV